MRMMLERERIFLMNSFPFPFDEVYMGNTLQCISGYEGTNGKRKNLATCRFLS